MTALRIAFAGTPQFSVAALRALAAGEHRVVGVLTQPDRPSGRGRSLAASPVKQAALELGLPLAQPSSLKEVAGRQALADWGADLLVVVAYGLLLPPEVLTMPRLGCINIHASLLPRWRGAAPIQRAILAGDAETGITIMQMDAGLDTGPMLLRRPLAIASQDTSASLLERLAPLGASALVDSIRGLQAGTLQPEPQPAAGATYAAKILKAEALIDWQEAAEVIDRKVRAFMPWPIAETRFAGEQLRILGTNAPQCPSIVAAENQSGLAYALDNEALLVRCGRGSLAITHVQRPGKRMVTAKDFVNSTPVLGQRFA